MTTSADPTSASAYDTIASVDFHTMPSVDSWHPAWSRSALGDPADAEEPQVVRSGQAPVAAAVAAAVLAFGLLGVVAWDHAGDNRSAVVTVVPAAAHPTAPSAASVPAPRANADVLVTAPPALPDIQPAPPVVRTAAAPVHQSVVAAPPPSPAADAPLPPPDAPAPAAPSVNATPVVIVNVPLPQLPAPSPVPLPKLPPPPSAPPAPPPLPTLKLPTPSLPAFCLPPKHLVNGQCA